MQALSPGQSSARIKQALRQLMKVKHVTYQDLADQLGISLATAKRLVSGEDLSLVRLYELADFFGMTLGEIEAFAASAQEDDGELYSEAQEVFFATEPRYYLYYAELFRHTPDEIAERYALTKQSTNRYLAKLERHGLIRTTGKGKVRPVFRLAPRWRRNGPLMAANFERLMDIYHRLFLKRAHPGGGDEDFTVVMKSRNLGRESFEELRKEIETMVQRLDLVSGYEEKTKADEEIGRCVFWSGIGWMSEDDPDMRVVGNAFGGVTNFD